MKGRYTGLALPAIAGVCILVCALGCRPERRNEPRHTLLRIQSGLPEDCRAAIHIYIDSQEMRVHPEQAIAAFHGLALRYSYAKDSAAHMVMRCYEGQAWDVLQAGDSILACYDDADLYLETHPELIDMRAMSYLFSGWAHYYKGNQLTANYYFSKAGNELEDTVYLNDAGGYIASDYPTRTRVALLTEIAQHAFSAELHEQARHYIQRALYAARLLGDSMPGLRASVLIQAGMIYSRAQKADSVAACFAGAIPILMQLRDTMLFIDYYDHRGAAFLAMHQYDSSLAAYQSVIKLQNASNTTAFEQAQTAQGIAASYIGLRRFGDAQAAINSARAVIYDDTAASLTERAAFSRTYLRYLVHNTAAAPVFEQFVALADSVFNQQRLNTISTMDARYGLQKKEARIGRLNRENQSFADRVAAQQTLLLFAILLIALLAVVVAFLRQRQVKKRLETERNKAILEQQLLRSQMEPHFIFNTLSVLQSLVRKDERERTIKYLSQFARLLRISLENARQALVPLSEEIEALHHYLSLQQVRFQDVFTYAIDAYEGYDDEAEDLLIPPMLLQPFVENAIQHGMAGMKNSAGRIRISIKKEEKVLRCMIEDNGAGNAQAYKDPAKKNSLSTTITRERLQLLSRQSGRPASLDVTRRPESAGGGMLVVLIIPFQEG